MAYKENTSIFLTHRYIGAVLNQDIHSPDLIGMHITLAMYPDFVGVYVLLKSYVSMWFRIKADTHIIFCVVC